MANTRVSDGLFRLLCAKSRETAELDIHMHLVHFTEARTADLREEAARDLELDPIIDIIVNGWPETQRELPEILKLYCSYRDEMSIDDGIVLK